MLILDRIEARGTVRDALKQKLGEGSLAASDQASAAAILRHPLAMRVLAPRILHAAQQAATTDTALAASIADANSSDETVAGGGLQNILNWIVQNWSQIAPIIIQIMSWFGIKAMLAFLLFSFLSLSGLLA